MANRVPLQAYDSETQGSLGEIMYPEFEAHATPHGRRMPTQAQTTWRQLASLNNYAAGKHTARVGLITPGPKEGMEPFMFLDEEPLVIPNTDLFEARMLLDGLCRYMSHPDKVVVYGFGEVARNIVHSLLNQRIDGS